MNLDPRIYPDFNHLMSFKTKVLSFRPFLQRPIYNLLTGRFKSKIKGQGMYFEEMAYYHPGDDVRNIDWKLTSKYRTPFVRKFTEEKERPVIIVADLYSTMFFGSHNKFKSAIACELASIVFWKSMDKRDPVGGFILSDDYQRYLRPSRSSTKSLQILKELAATSSSLNNNSIDTKYESLDKGLRSLENSIASNSLVIFISDFLEYDSKAKDTLKRIAKRNELVGLRVSDQFEADPVFHISSFVISNGRDQVFINSSDKETNKEYLNYFSKDRSEIRDIFNHLQAPLIEINTKDELLKQLEQLSHD